MITVKKLLTLGERTRLRKISMILHQAAVDCHNGVPVDIEYVNDVLPIAGFEPVDASMGNASLSFKLCCRYGRYIKLGINDVRSEFLYSSADLVHARIKILITCISGKI